MSAPDEADYVNRLIAALAPLVNRYHLEISGLGAMYGDQGTANLVTEALNGARFVSLNDSYGGDTLDWIRSLDCLIGSRLHHCILGLVTGTPVVAADPYLDPITQTSKLREFVYQAKSCQAYLPMETLLSREMDVEDLVHAG